VKELIVVNNLTKKFNLSRKQQKIGRTKEKVKTAVDDLSFTCYEGEIFGLLGPNGAGKTTTLRIMSTLIKPNSGDCIVNGKSAVKTPAEVRQQIGFLTSELKLEDFFTPNYLFDFFAKMFGIEPEQAEKRKKELFERFGIDKFAEVKVAELSTGMKQKSSLAISLIHDPKIIIFDEPTNGLDVLTAKVVTDYLLELKQQGKTIIVSTHIFSLIEKICDRVGIIIDGRMTLCDTLENICAENDLETVFFDIFQKVRGEE